MTEPPVNAYAEPMPSPAPPWQPAQLPEYTAAPSPSGPVAFAVTGFMARTYMNAHTGRMLRVSMAHTGIFLRAL